MSDHEREEGEDQYVFDAEEAKRDDEIRAKSMKAPPLALRTGPAALKRASVPDMQPEPMGTPRTSGKPGQKASRRTSLLHLMMSGGASRADRAASQQQAPSTPLAGREGDSDSSPLIQSALKQDAGRELRSNSNLSIHSIGSSQAAGGMKTGLGGTVGRAVSAVMSAVDSRRSSIMARAGFLGVATSPRTPSLDVTALLAEQARSRPVSEPAHPRVPSAAIKSASPTTKRALTEEEKAWEERWTIDDLPYYYNKKTEVVTWEKPDALKTDEELENEAGIWTWVPHPVNVWQGARVTKTMSNGDTQCKTLIDSKVVLVPASKRLKDAFTAGRDQVVPLWPLSRSSLYLLEDDLVALDDPNEALIMHNTAQRYREDKIYTWVGASRSVLVSVNPYKHIKGLYNQAMIEDQAEKSPNRPPPPHVFGIAADSLEALLYDATDNSILISGESGAGKTEATKHVLKFLATVAGTKTHVEKRVLDANPILEAFGNAKTMRNNNSSRFGKWIEINFDSKTRQISGASLTTYLLERSRVAYQAKGERNFHIFYQLCSNENSRTQFGLALPESFRYLNTSGCTKVDGVDDAEELVVVQRCMTEMDFDVHEQDWTLRMVCAVLHLGNIDFLVSDDGEGSKISTKARGGRSNRFVPSLKVASTPTAAAGSGAASGRAKRFSLLPVDVPAAETGVQHLRETARLLGVESSELERVLCTRSIRVKDDRSVIGLTPDQARANADAFASSLYGRLFEWLVGRLNASLGGGGRGHFIGVLDIFGFEIFEKNSFEQLCINFANEKLQQQFNESMFKEEEGLYVFEEIDYKKITFKDNSPVLQLIEGRPDGLLPQLDDEVKAPGGSDARYASKMATKHAQPIPKPSSVFIVDAKKKFESNLAFQIVHYAGVVKYDAHGFVQANTETLFEDIHFMAHESRDVLTKAIFPLDDDDRPTRYVAPIMIAGTNAMGGRATLARSVASKSTIIPTTSSGSMTGPRGRSGTQNGLGLSGAQAERAARAANQSGVLKRAGTVSSQFRDQLSELMDVLALTESRYIRCVKPNARQAADDFNHLLVLEQLRYSGVFEAVEIRRHGFPFRLQHKQFCFQYQCINSHAKIPVKYRSAEDDYKALAQEILDASPQNFRGVKIGKTRVLYKAKEHKILLLLRNLALEKTIPWLQARLRGYVARRMRAVFKECDGLFQDALDLETDIDALEDSLKEAESLIGETIPRLFPRAEPSKRRRVLQVIEDLKMWLELETELEAVLEKDAPEEGEAFDALYVELKTLAKKCESHGHVPKSPRQTRLLDQLLEKLEKLEKDRLEQLLATFLTRAKSALASLNREGMKATLVDGEAYENELNTRGETVLNEIRSVLEDMSRVDEEAKQAIHVVSRQRMENALRDGEKYGFTTTGSDYLECARLLKLSEKAFCELELAAATRDGDEPRRVHREIRLYEMYIEENARRLGDFTKLSCLRTPDSFARARFTTIFFGREALARSMMCYTAKPVHTHVTKLLAVNASEDVSEGTHVSTDPAKKKRAALCAKMIWAWMGLLETTSPDDALRSLLSMGLSDVALRDEILCLLVKQLTEKSSSQAHPGPSSEVLERTLDLLGMCLETFPPNEPMRDRLVVWLRDRFAAEPDKLKKYTAAMNETRYGEPRTTLKSVEDIKRTWKQRTHSRYSLQPGQASGPSEEEALSTT